MDQREHQLLFLSVCHRLFNFIMKRIASQALKTVTLGHPFDHRSTQVPISRDAGNGTESKDNNHSNGDSEKMPEEEAPVSTSATEPKPPKKTVSIKGEVEEISRPKKSKKTNKTAKRLISSEPKEDDPKPLRSILKVGSKLNENSDSFVNRTSDG